MSMFDDVLGMGRTSIFEGAYEPEVEAITLESAEDIPDYMDPMEFMTQVACEQEINMQRLDMAIMAEEYVYLRENGVEMVEESAVDTALSLVKKCQDGIMQVWAKIQSFFKMVQTKLREADKRDEVFVKTYKEKAIAGGAAKVTVNNLVNRDTLTTISGNAKTMYGDIVTAANTIYRNAGTNESKKDDLVKTAVASIFGDKVSDTNNTAKLVLKQMVKDAKNTKNLEDGTKATEVVEMQPKDAIEEFLTAKNLKYAIEDSYKASKKAINVLLKSAKSMEASLKKKKNLATDESKNVHQSVKAISAVQKILVQANKTEVKLFNMRKAMLKKMILASAAQGSKKITNGNKMSAEIDAANNIKKKTGKNESFIEAVQFGEIL